jgi:transcriptional regulator with XRE-family HTH domain
VTRPTIDDKETLKDVLRQWLATVRKSTGWSFERIAREADVSPTTLTRFMKPDYPHLLGLDTIRKIAAATRIAAPSELGIELKPSGFGESELKHWAPAPENLNDTTILSNSVDWWEVRSFLLDLEGLLPGDKIAVDLNKRAQPGDIVMAQVESQGGRDVETVLRKYEPPMLTCRTTQRDYPGPEFVDGARVIIMGVAVSLRREMRAP